MDRFWIEVMCEVAKDACCDLAAAIEQGRPAQLACHRALVELEQLKVCICGLSETFIDEEPDPVLPVAAEGV